MIPQNAHQDLNLLDLNRLPTRTTLVPYTTREAALSGVRNASPCFLLLNGTWDFHLEERGMPRFPEKAAEPTTGRRAPIIVPGSWQAQGFGRPQYINQRYPIPYDPPYVPDDTPVGCYRRQFTLPERFMGQQLLLRFEGVDGCAGIYLNGYFVGMNKIAHLPAEFDVTELVTPGVNDLQVMVYQWSDATYLEDQDKWRLSGIFRDVMLLGLPQARVTNLLADGDYDPATGEGILSLTVLTSGLSSVRVSLEREGQILMRRDLSVSSGQARLLYQFPNAAPWTAETPNLYHVLVEGGGLFDALDVGFRRVRVEGGRFLVNGQPVKLRGVNRHDTHCDLGPVSTVEQMRQDVLLIKRHNFNTVRASHYPNDPRFLEFCDFYGLYVIDEADVECHGVVPMSGNYDLIADDPAWEKPILTRSRRMIARDRNHACIVMWSMGNESGFGCNFIKAIEQAHRLDPTRPVHYERDQLAQYADVASSMYPPVEQVEREGRKQGEKPYFLCEYAHAMGQAPGNLADYWALIEASPRLMGGCIWELIDHGLRLRDGYGAGQFGYGGDFGDTPNDGHFCIDALCSPERKPHSAMLEARHVLRPVRMELLDEAQGLVRIHNAYDFLSLSSVTLKWRIENGGASFAVGRLTLNVPPHGAQVVRLPLGEYPRGSVLCLAASLAEDTAWAQAGHTVALDQAELAGGYVRAPHKRFSQKLCWQRHEDDVTARCGETELHFSRHDGLRQLAHQCTQLLQSPVALHIWRAPTDNDAGHMGLLATWEKAELNRLEKRVVNFEVREDSDSLTLSRTTVYAPASFRPVLSMSEAWRLRADGALVLRFTFTPLQKLPALPCLGVRFDMPRAFGDVCWQGRGPQESYPDKKTGALLGRYCAKVEEMEEDYLFPQETGSHEDTSFLLVSQPTGTGLFIAGERFAFSARPHTIEQLEAAQHLWELPAGDRTQLTLDVRMGPLGNGSCGYGPLDKDLLILDKPLTHRFVLIPADLQAENADALHAQAQAILQENQA